MLYSGQGIEEGAERGNRREGCGERIKIRISSPLFCCSVGAREQLVEPHLHPYQIHLLFPQPQP